MSGAKLAYTSGTGSSTEQTMLYFVDMGRCVVKVRATVSDASAQAVDDFVRAQRWDTLQPAAEAH